MIVKNSNLFRIIPGSCGVLLARLILLPFQRNQFEKIILTPCLQRSTNCCYAFLCYICKTIKSFTFIYHNFQMRAFHIFQYLHWQDSF